MSPQSFFKARETLLPQLLLQGLCSKVPQSEPPKASRGPRVTLFLTLHPLLGPHPPLGAVQWLLGDGLVCRDFCFLLLFLPCSKEGLPVSPGQLQRPLTVQVKGCLGLVQGTCRMGWVQSDKMLCSGVGNSPVGSKVREGGEKALQASEERFPLLPWAGLQWSMDFPAALGGS